MATPLRYEVVRHDGTTVDVSRQVTLGKLKYGVEISEEFRPFAKSTGEININNWRSEYTDHETWDRINIYVNADLLFACSIISIGVYGAYGRLRVFIELLATANLPYQAVRRTTGSEDVLLEDFVAASGVAISVPAGVNLPAMYVARGTGYIRADQPDDGGSEFMTDLLTFGTMFGFEHPRENSFVVYPLSALGDDDRQAEQEGRVASRTALIKESDLKLTTETWRYGLQTLNAADVQVATKTMTRARTVSWNGVQNGTVTQWFTVSDLIGRTNAEDWLHWTSVVFSFVGYSGPTPVLQMRDDGSVSIYIPRGPSGLQTPGGLEFTSMWLATTSSTTSLETISVGQPDAATRELATSGLPMPLVGGDSRRSTILAVLNTLEVLFNATVTVQSMTQLIEQNGDLSALKVICGDVVDIDLRTSDHRAVLVGLEFQHKGLRPLQLRWHVIRLGARVPLDFDRLSWKIAAGRMFLGGKRMAWERVGA